MQKASAVHRVKNIAVEESTCNCYSVRNTRRDGSESSEWEQTGPCEQKLDGRSITYGIGTRRASVMIGKIRHPVYPQTYAASYVENQVETKNDDHLETTPYQ